MSHPGKFVSVNLNRSYGQSSQSQHGGRPSRPAGGPYSAGGGGMVVLSRGRGSGSSSVPKPQQPKLSVPPPLNLPSLRKEHERFDGAAATSAGGAASAPARSGGAVAGWTKPAPASENSLGSAPPPSGVARAPLYGFQEKAFLRGEDFPSLKAAVAPPPQPPAQHRHKDGDGAPEARPMPLGMRPQVLPLRGSEPSLASGAGAASTVHASSVDKVQKLDLGPLPLVRLRYNSDWADDERDTGLSLPERDTRETGFGRSEPMAYGAMREPLKNDSFGRDSAAATNEGGHDGPWRSPMPNYSRERTDGRPYSAGKGGIANVASKDFWSSNKEPPARAYGQNGTELYGTTQLGETAGERHSDNSNNWYRGNPFQNSAVSKVQPYLGNKGPLINDPGTKFGRGLIGSSAKPLVKDISFDSISAVNLSSIKKKKEATKPSDFHDPARESFEAELDRILRIQEQERQRVVEEQTRVREIARKQDEERERLIREEEERRRLVEEEARQAAWQAEQETLEAARRAEEQRIAREEEKMRIAMEEERRREAARQKLIELESRIARRRAESNMSGGNLDSAANDELALGALKDRDVSHYTNAGERRDIDRMGELISTSAASESSKLSRYSDTVPRVLHTLGDGHSCFVDREHVYHSAGAAFEGQENPHYSPRRDILGAKRGSFPKKDSYDGFGAVGSSSRGQTTESPWAMEDYRQGRVPRWDAPRENDHFDKQSEFETDFFNSDRFGDAAWLPSGSYGSPNGQQGDRMFQNSETNDFSSFTRSRYSMRQPRVPPPPVVTSMHRRAISASTQRANSSFTDGGLRESSSRDDEQTMHSQYGSAYQEVSHQPATPAEDLIVTEQHSGDRASPILGSQSSLSISSPPSSPPHVSHDEMDVSGDSPALPTSADGDRTVESDNDHVASTRDAANLSRIATSSTASHMEDDEWPSEHNEAKQQDEYDEGGNSYQEDDINDVDDDNLDLDHQFADGHLDLDDEFADGHNTPVEMETVILGFDEGVQVEIPLNSEVELTPVKSTEREVGVHTGVVERELYDGSIDPCDLVTEAEQRLENLDLDQTNALTSESNGDPYRGTVASSSKLPRASFTHTIESSASTVIDQNEVPVSLQFGLFSGPSLIPTTVPAIQIGSIQMPIHLHNQINPSLALLPSPAPLFQFGQLRYVRPASQNVQPHSQATPYSSAPDTDISKQNGSSCFPNVMNQDANHNVPREAVSSSFTDKSILPSPELLFVTDRSNFNQLNAPANNQMVDVNGYHSRLDRISVEENANSGVSKRESQRNHKSTSNNRESSQFGSYGKALSGPKAPGAVSGGRGKRYGYAVKESHMGSTSSVVEPSHKDSRGIQRRSRKNIRRTEFRVRENVEKSQIQVSESFSHDEHYDMPFPNGSAREISVRNVNKMEGDKSFRANEASDISGAGPSSMSADYYSKTERMAQKAPSYEGSHYGNKKGRASEGDASTSVQAVRVVKQQGIEVPVDADGFIEVRSKKQIMSVRREQREKENRSRLRMAKAPRKQHQISLHSSSSSSFNNKGTVSLGGAPTKKVSSDSVPAVEGRTFDHIEPSSSLISETSSMTPAGPPSANTGSQTIYYAKKPIQGQATSESITSSAAAKLVAGVSESNNKASSISTPFNMGSWDSSQTNQQVMSLTQTQLEEAMEPAKFERAGSAFPLEANNALSSTITTENAYTLSASPINSLLAGEKIQFGAVTSPTVLVPITRTISSGLGAPGSSRPDMKIDRSLPSDTSGAAALFDKEKATTKEPGPNPEEVGAEAEAEAEAAASAVAVAAICSDETVASTADATAVSAPDNKSFSSKDHTGLTAGGAVTGQRGQSSREEALMVALPADLSVDTPSMSLWPPLTSPQASGSMLSQFAGAQPSHFSCFEVNTMLGAHPFAFGPSDESAGIQGQQPQRSNTLPSAPLGAWPQCHSVVDSFYRPPTGFAGPFISPGGIPGVQGPPHMVVYNHFAPVGQFGQMGLGFMGATYIPGDKQPDWKQNQGPSVGISQGDPNNQTMLPGQVASHSVPTQVQHLHPTSIMPIPSPLTMFDMTPFQSSGDIQMQPCWPHMPVHPLHSVPLSVQLQQHPIEGTAVPQYVHNMPSDKSSTNERFQEPSTSAMLSDSNKSFPSTAASQFSDELSLVKPPASSSSDAKTVQPSFVRTGVISNEVPNSAKAMVRTNPPNMNPGNATGVTSNPNSGQVANMPSKPHQSSSSSDQQYRHPVNNQDHRARVSQKTGTSNEWQRRSGYMARSQNTGSDKKYGTGRMKQIYVPKSSTTNGPAPSG